jgi:hypothetical protein
MPGAAEDTAAGYALNLRRLVNTTFASIVSRFLGGRTPVARLSDPNFRFWP